MAVNSTASVDQPAVDRPRRLVHFTPLRYPGGKGKLALFVKRLMRANRLLDGEYVEPYAGGAAIALELLFHEYVSRVHINDVSRPVYAFWKSVLDHTDELCRLIRDTPMTMEARAAQKKVLLARRSERDDVTLGFATFFLNRTNRSGILNGGVIGGLDQTGPWKMDARYNAPELINRITSIAKMRDRISLTGQDALDFLSEGVKKWPDRTLIYLDPPYYVKGRDLYQDYYHEEDHKNIARFVRQKITRQKWIVSYDSVPAVHELYEGYEQVVYRIGYSARSSRQGSEVMFFCDGLTVPSLMGAMNPIEGPGLFA
jgi:DNA adenine methylase